VNKENASKLWKMIQEAGDYLMGYPDILVDINYADNLLFNDINNFCIKTNI